MKTNPVYRLGFPRRALALALVAGTLVQGLPTGANATPAAAAAAATRAGHRDIRWEELVPKGWDPSKAFRDIDLGQMKDGDPRTDALLKQMRDVWDNAPTNDELDGRSVRLPGYLVPLDEVKGEIREFLLVPYMGACIHTPPPPANQIVHVRMDKPVKGLRTMDAIWVRGVLKIQRVDTAMGVSGYRMEAASAVLYEEPRRK